MKRLAVIDVVGLSQGVIGAHTPFLQEWQTKHTTATINPVLPAVTCSAQATYLTGQWPSEHGIVGNGWFFRDECEVKLWRQSNKLVDAKKIWEYARERNADFTCANLFWWYNMYSSVDFSVTPRPQYLADGRKKPDCYSHPAQLRDSLQEKLGPFPLFDFWGPKTSIRSSQWIADAAKYVHKRYHPILSLVYLPHMDYSLQKYGQHDPRVNADLFEIDALLKDLVAYFEGNETEVLLISEYGISNVNRPVHINRILRENGLIAVREQSGYELLDAGASEAFAVADHQIAHIYINNKSKVAEVQKLLANTTGIEVVLDEHGQRAHHLNHPRSGELVAIADPDAWFTYYYWQDDKRAPDFARTVDIHNKPGYDPVEMFLDPQKKLIIPRILLKVLKKKLGFRTLMDVIPLDASLISGSHGRHHLPDAEKPLLIGPDLPVEVIEPTDVCQLLLNKLAL